MPESRGFTFDEWWRYVVKHEIEPTMRAYAQPPLILTPISTVGFRKLPKVSVGEGDAP